MQRCRPQGGLVKTHLPCPTTGGLSLTICKLFINGVRPLLAVRVDTWWYSDSSLSSGAHAAVIAGGIVKLEAM